MSFLPLALASIIFALGPPAALAHFDSISFSPVQQCGNFTVLFSGGVPPAALPLSLTVVPFNLTPIVIGIADSAWNNITFKGAAITFLPFPAGTEFVASLDDAEGNSAASVSDVIKIQPSYNTSCLSTTTAALGKRFIVDQPLSQCKDFDVTYDPSLVTSPPSIRAFTPRGTSFPVNESATAGYLGQATYTMDAIRGQQVILMLSDEAGTREATDLLTVGGDTSSPTDCLLPLAPTISALPQNSTKTGGQSQNHQSGSGSSHSQTKLSKPAMIGIAVAIAVVVGGLAAAIVCWLCREQRRVRIKRLQSFEESFTIITDKELDAEKGIGLGSEPTIALSRVLTPSSPLSFPPDIPLPKTPPPTFRNSRFSEKSRYSSAAAFVKDPLYTDPKLDLMSPTSAQFDSHRDRGLRVNTETPLSSIPVPLVTPVPIYASVGNSTALETSLRRPARSRPPSLSSDDIEHILDMATLYSPTTPASTVSISTDYHDSMSITLLKRPIRAEDAPQDLSPRQRNYVLRASPAATPTLSDPPRNLLTPDSASLRREPPQALLPSSPVPSPTISRYFRPSMSSEFV